MNKPIIFIGSSSEGLPIAYAIQENMENESDVIIWTQGVFDLGNSYLESLIEQLDKADFAILVLTEDDITISRNQETVSPRDNVLFELGLFMGRLGRNRSFFVFDQDKTIKIPSDLSGISAATFKTQLSGNLAASLGPACNKIRNAITKTGRRAKINQSHLNAYNERFNFCNKIEGYWWERIKPDTASALSFVHVTYDAGTLMLEMRGRSFDTGGNFTAHWKSKSTCIHFQEEKVFYHWQGWFPETPNDKFEGVGEISFSGSKDQYDEGNGVFSNINVADLKSIQNSSFELRRSTTTETDIMSSKDKGKITQLIREKISQMF